MQKEGDAPGLSETSPALRIPGTGILKQLSIAVMGVSDR